MTETTKNRKTIRGEVVSDAMDKTIVVLVKRYVKHPKYGKFIKQSKRIKAHDADNTYKVGDKVVIEETKPLAKTKSFKVIATY